MTSSGYSPPPTPPKGPQSYPPSRAETAVEILDTTRELKNVSRATRITGTVTRIQKDGTAQIRTDKGEMTVKIRGRAKPAEGQQVEIDIPAGKPPRKAKVRPAPDTEQTERRPRAPHSETSAKTRRSDTTQTRKTKPAPRERSPRTPARPESSPRLADDLSRTLQSLRPDTGTPRRPVTLQTGDLVRLTPITPAQLESLIQTQTPETTASKATAKAVLALSQQAIQVIADTVSNGPAIHTASTAPPPVIPETAALYNLVTDNMVQHSPPALQTAPADGAVFDLLQSVRSAPPGTMNTISDIARPSVTLTPLSKAAPQAKTLLSAPLLSSGTMPAVSPITSAPGDLIRLPALLPEHSQANRLIKTPGQAFADMRITSLTAAPAVLSPPGHTAALQTASLGKTTTTQQTAASQNSLSGGRAETITATVTAKTKSALPLLRLNSGFFDDLQPQFFILQTQTANLIPGMQVELVPHGPQTSSPHTSSLSQPPVAGGIITPPWQLFGSFEWPALEQIQQSLQQAAPQVAANITQSMPSPATPQRLPAAALFFIAAIKAGNVQNWLGNKAVGILKRAGKENLLSKLGSDFLGLNKTGSEPLSHDWRALSLPLAWQDQIDKAMLYYRRGRDDDQAPDDDARQKATRFIFDLNLSRMGAVQLDGLHRADRLDVILRTTKPLSRPMQKVMKQKYISVLEDCGVAGQIKFQDDPQTWVEIDIQADDAGAAFDI